MTTKTKSNISTIGWYQIIGGGIGALIKVEVKNNKSVKINAFYQSVDEDHFRSYLCLLFFHPGHE